MAKTILIVELLLGGVLLVGMFLARTGRFRAHGICQTTVIILNLVPITLFMLPEFRSAVIPALPAGLHDRFYAITTAHAALGSIAELIGIYILLVAGTKLLPEAARFQNWKAWMRTELVLWWVVITLGLVTYGLWNGGSRQAPQPTTVTGPQNAPAAPAAKTITVDIVNKDFKPKELQIEAGTVVIWKNTEGRHTVTADDGSFDSPIMAPGEEFRQTFSHAGKIQYFCKLHGAAGGHNMAGTITVK